MNKTILFGDLDLEITNQSSVIGGVWSEVGDYRLQDNDLFEKIYSEVVSHPNPCVIDVGANTGCLGLFNKNLGFPIFAIEPNKLAFQELLNNVWLNQCNTLCYNLAASDKIGELNMTEYPELWGYGYNRITEENTKYVVNALPLDLIVPFNLEITHVKIDVEGYELFVLKGMARILSSKPIIYIEMMEENFGRYNYTSDELSQLLSQFGYEKIKIDDKNYKFV
jgi:FkbM family methyltransferase